MNACTLGDACENGACADGKEPLVCDTGSICAPEVCESEYGCIPVPADGAACNDGDRCTLTDICVDGIYTGVEDKRCDEDNLCTDNACDPADDGTPPPPTNFAEPFKVVFDGFDPSTFCDPATALTNAARFDIYLSGLSMAGNAADAEFATDTVANEDTLTTVNVSEALCDCDGDRLPIGDGSLCNGAVCTFGMPGIARDTPDEVATGCK